jgi:hypothetical protein
MTVSRYIFTECSISQTLGLGHNTVLTTINRWLCLIFCGKNGEACSRFLLTISLPKLYILIYHLMVTDYWFAFFQFMRCFENHHVVAFEELRNSHEVIPIHKPIFCEIHPAENMKFFCLSCQVITYNVRGLSTSLNNIHYIALYAVCLEFVPLGS